MRTASAAQFIQEQGGELTLQSPKEDLRSHDSSDEAELSHVPYAQASRREVCISKRGNKIFERNIGQLSAALQSRKSDDSDTDEQEPSVCGSCQLMNSFSTLLPQNTEGLASCDTSGGGIMIPQTNQLSSAPNIGVKNTVKSKFNSADRSETSSQEATDSAMVPENDDAYTLQRGCRTNEDVAFDSFTHEAVGSDIEKFIPPR